MPLRNKIKTLEQVGGCVVCLAVLALLGSAVGGLGFWLAEWWGIIVAVTAVLGASFVGFLWFGWHQSANATHSPADPLDPEIDSSWGRRAPLPDGSGALDEAGARHGLWSWTWRNGGLRQQTHFVHGVPDGVHTSWHDNGEKEYSGAFAAGLRTGRWVQWYRNGQRAAERDFVADRAEGASTAWWETGERRWLVHFHDDQEHGLASYWTRGGTLLRQGTFESGFRSGEWQAWHDNTQLAAVEHYRSGVADGVFATFDCAGQQLDRIQWREGMREGTATVWYATGQIRSVGTYLNDLRHGDWSEWHENGTLLTQETYARDRLHGEALYWNETGGVREQSNWRHGQRHGGTARFHDNGQIAFTGGYRRDKPHGLWSSWDDQGQILSAITYRLGKLHGSWRRWHSSGFPWVETSYQRGLLHGAWTQYRPDGSLWSQVHFVYGVPLERGFFRFQDPQELDHPPTNRWFLLFWLVLAAIGLLTIGKEIALGVGVCAVLLAITIHEAGHYLAAWLVGIPIRTFRVGAGPVLARCWLGTATFELSLLPFLGYVMPHMMRPGQRAFYYAARRAFRRGEPLPPDAPGGGVSRKPASEIVAPLRRLVFLLGGVGFNLLTAAALFYASSLFPPAPPGQVETLILEEIRLQRDERTTSQEKLRTQLALKRLERDQLVLANERILLNRRAEYFANDIRWMNQPSIKPAERERRHAHVVRRLRQLQREEDGWQQRWQAQQRQEQERSVLVEKVAELARKEVDLARQLHHVRAQLADLPELPPRDGLEGVGRSLIDESPRSALQNYAIFNIIVAIFNLFPIPPLDGYHCLAVVLHLVFGRRLSTRLKNAINLFGCLMMLVMLGVSVYFLVREVLGILLRGPEP